MTHRQIEAFRAVMLAGTMVGAADQLHVSQPAVSRLVADLERDLGYALFHRQRGRLVPSEEAGALFREVERAFVGLERIAAVARAIGDCQVGHLRVVAMPIFGCGFLPHVVATFCQGRSDISVTLELRPRVRVLEWIAAQQFDVGLATLPVDDPAVAVRPFAEEHAVCILPTTHALAALTVIEAGDLHGQTLIGFPRETSIRSMVDAMLAAARVTVHCLIETRTAEAVRGLVAAGAGIALVSRFALFGLDDPRLAVRPFTPPLPIRSGLLLPTGRPPSRLTDRFASHVAAHYAAQVPATGA